MTVAQLTWQGFDAAIDVIAAQCFRSHSGVYGASQSGIIMSIALAYRLQLPVLTEPEDRMLLVDGWTWNRMLSQFADSYKEVETWVWVDTTPYFYNAVCHMDGVTCVAMPWQDAALDKLEHFLPGFHD